MGPLQISVFFSLKWGIKTAGQSGGGRSQLPRETEIFCLVRLSHTTSTSADYEEMRTNLKQIRCKKDCKKQNEIKN